MGYFNDLDARLKAATSNSEIWFELEGNEIVDKGYKNRDELLGYIIERAGASYDEFYPQVFLADDEFSALEALGFDIEISEVEYANLITKFAPNFEKYIIPVAHSVSNFTNEF